LHYLRLFLTLRKAFGITLPEENPGNNFTLHNLELISQDSSRIHQDFINNSSIINKQCRKVRKLLDFINR